LYPYNRDAELWIKTEKPAAELRFSQVTSDTAFDALPRFPIPEKVAESPKIGLFGPDEFAVGVVGPAPVT
jgi:hypothetical protein